MILRTRFTSRGTPGTLGIVVIFLPDIDKDRKRKKKALPTEGGALKRETPKRGDSGTAPLRHMVIPDLMMLDKRNSR